MWALVERAHDAFSCDVSVKTLGNGLGIHQGYCRRISFESRRFNSFFVFLVTLIRQPSTNSTQESYVQLSQDNRTG